MAAEIAAGQLIRWLDVSSPANISLP
jgi:hypothetical protein